MKPKDCQREKRKISGKPAINVHCDWDIFTKIRHALKKMERIYLKQIIFSLPAPKGCQREKRRISDKPAINARCDWDICTKIKHALESNGADLF